MKNYLLHSEKRFYCKSYGFITCVLVISGLIYGSTLCNCSQIKNNTNIEDRPQFFKPNPSSWLTSVAPIFIDGEEGWQLCPWVNGSGTWDDPYILRNLTIDAGWSGNCIKISNSSKYFQVINCSLEYSAIGIFLNETSNGTIFNNTCFDNGIGIVLSASTNNIVVGNNCSKNDEGICLELSSNNNTILENTCTENSNYGIYGNLVTDNIFTTNYCTDNWIIGIYLNNSDNNTILNNVCSSNGIKGTFGPGIGIQLEYSNNNTLFENNCSVNFYIGINLESGNNNTFTENNCTRNAYYGMILASSNGTYISRNNCSRSLVGIDLGRTCVYNEISENWLFKCRYSPIDSFNELPNDIHNNSVIYWPSVTFTSDSKVVPTSNQIKLITITTGAFVTFTSTVYWGVAPFTYKWDFGDNTSISSLPNPIRQFNSAGSWEIWLTVTDAEGDKAYFSMVVIVYQGWDVFSILIFGVIFGALCYVMSRLKKRK